MEPFAEKLLKSFRTFASRWEGADARVTELTRSHQSLRIVLYRPENADPTKNLTIAAIEPTWIKGPLRWPDCRLQIEARGKAFRVHDDAAGFEVIAGKVEVAEHVKGAL